MHPIREYCENKGITQKAFAQRVGLSEGFISQLVRGREFCGRAAGLQIVEECGGAISLEALLTWKPAVRAAS